MAVTALGSLPASSQRTLSQTEAKFFASRYLLFDSRALTGVELSRSAAVVWLVRAPTSRRWKGGGMAHESPPSRASPRPLAGVLGCLTAASAPAQFSANEGRHPGKGRPRSVVVWALSTAIVRSESRSARSYSFRTSAKYWFRVRVHLSFGAMPRVHLGYIFT